MTQGNSCLQELLLSVLGYDSLPACHPSRSPAALLSTAVSQADVASLLQKHCCCLPTRLQLLTDLFDGVECSSRQAQLSLLAVACFRLFRTANAYTHTPEHPEDPFHVLEEQSQKHDCQHCSKDGFSSSSWAIQQLSADGEDPVGPIKAPQYLVVALALLNKPLGLQVLSPEPSTAPQCAATTLGTSMTTLGSSPEEAAIQSSIIAAESASPGVVWWAARAVFLQQRLLPRPSLSLQRALVHLLATAAAPASEAALQEVAPLVTQPGSVPPTARILNAALNAARQIESSLVWLEYRHVSTASEHAACALRELNMQISTVGALGKRTEAQQSAKAQLILHVDWQSEGGEDTGRKQQGMLEGCGWQGYPAQEVWPQAEQQKGSGWDGWVDDSGVRHVPQLQNGAERVLVLAPLEQAAVLANATLQRKGKARSDSIADWLVAPAVEALLMQQHTAFAVAACTLLLRIRHELERARVRERGLIALQALYDFLKDTPLESHKMEPLLYTTPLPLHCDVRAEIAGVWVKAGMMGQAMQEYEALERWEKLVDCYMFCHKAAAAENVLRERLQVDSQNPQLLCAMGKLLRQDEWFERAWQASGCKHAGSQRELARTALSRTEHESAADHFTLALSRNPLDAESWFGLGFCELKRGPDRAGHAAVAFTRCVQADGSHGEAWNNLGALHVAAARYGPALKALTVAIKLCGRSWQISDNYSVSAMHCREFTTAAKASIDAVKLSSGTHVNTEVLAALVSEVESRRGAECSTHDPHSLEQAQHRKNEGPQLAPLGSAQQAELHTSCSDGEEGKDRDMGEEAAQLLEMFAAFDFPQGAPVETAASAAAAASVQQDDSDAHLRQRDMLEVGVKKALDAACNASKAPAEAFEQHCRFHRATGDINLAKEVGFKWLRTLQAHGWQEDEASTADVTSCCQSLYRLHMAGVATSGDADELKKWWSPLRLQVSSASRAVVHSLGEDNALALELQQLASDIVSQTR